MITTYHGLVIYRTLQIWLLVAPMLIMVVLPKLMKNVDPETQKVCHQFTVYQHCIRHERKLVVTRHSHSSVIAALTT